jgi:diguanylate cyclase (GGDEF)-like protein/PAS domain S-box-containing protein
MQDPSRTNQELLEEISDLKQRISDWEQSEAEHKRTVGALRESEERYRTLIENANEAIFVAQDWKLVFLNPMTSQMIGYSPEELMAKPFVDFIHPDDRSTLVEHYFNRLKGDDFQSRYPYRLIQRDGGFLWIEGSAVLIEWKGKPATLNFLTDITDRKQAEKVLQESEKRFDQLAQQSGTITWEVDAQGIYTYVSHVSETVLGYRPDEIVGQMHFYDLHPESEREAFKKAALAVFEQKKSFTNLENAAKTKEGRHVWLSTNGIPLLNADGTLRGYRGTDSDITERKKAEEALKGKEAQIRLLLDSTAEAIYGIDLQGNCTFANPSCFKMLGYADIDQLLGKNMHQLIHYSYPDGNPMTVEDCRIYRAFHKGKGEHVDNEVLWRADGTSFPVEYWSYPEIFDGEICGAVVTFIDITERKKAEEQIQHLATHDLLTELPGLRLAKDRLTVALNMAHRNKKSAAVMFIDLDGFKAVNDTLGHDAGDYVLKQVAQRMLSCVRQTDTVARVGGDEFLIIATEINTPENASQIAEKIIQAVSQPIIFNGQRAVVGISIGIAIFPDHGKDMDQLIKLADVAMYRVKDAGKNGFCFINTTLK